MRRRRPCGTDERLGAAARHRPTATTDGDEPAATGDNAHDGGGRTTPTTPSPSRSEADWARVDEYLQDRLLGAGDFAFGVAVSIDGVPVHAASFGDRNSPNMVPPAAGTANRVVRRFDDRHDHDVDDARPCPIVLEPVDASDRFRIASISKVITGTVALQLVDDGTLTLDDPVGALLGDHLGVEVRGRPPAAITVRQLLSHTSGFSEFYDTFFSRRVESCREAAARGLDAGVQFDPGTTYEYSQMNFCLLSILIEIVTGKPYETVVQERLLTPLGINGMRLAGTFDPQPDEVVHPSFPNRNYMEVLGGAGSWVATPADVVKIVDSLDNTNPGFHPLAGRPRPADAQAAGRHRLPVDAGAVVRAGDDGLRQPVVGSHGNGREHPRDGRPPSRRDDLVDPRQRQLPRGHARPRGDLPGRPRPSRDRRPGADDVDHDDDVDDHDLDDIDDAGSAVDDVRRVKDLAGRRGVRRMQIVGFSETWVTPLLRRWWLVVAVGVAIAAVGCHARAQSVRHGQGAGHRRRRRFGAGGG